MPCSRTPFFLYNRPQSSRFFLCSNAQLPLKQRFYLTHAPKAIYIYMSDPGSWMCSHVEDER